MGIVVQFQDINKVFTQACNDVLLSRQIQSIYAILSGDSFAPHRGEVHPVIWLRENNHWIRKIDNHIENDSLVYTGLTEDRKLTISPHNEYCIKVTLDKEPGASVHYLSTTHEYSDSHRPLLDIEFELYDLIIREYNPMYGQDTHEYGTFFNIPQGRFSRVNLSYYTEKISSLRTLTLLPELIEGNR